MASKHTPYGVVLGCVTVWVKKMQLLFCSLVSWCDIIVDSCWNVEVT